MSWLSGATELVAGGWLSSAYPGLGATGAAIKAAGATGEHGAGVGLNDGLLDAREYLFEVAAQPAGGTVVFSELGQATLMVTADGAYAWTYRLREDGAYVGGPIAVTTTIGGATLTLAAANCSQANASSAGAASFSGGTISLQAASCAQAGSCTAGAVSFSISAIALQAAGCTQATSCSAGAVLLLAVGEVLGRYCQTQSLRTRYGEIELIQLTNPDDPAAETVSAPRVADAIADIDAIVDAKLAARYALPLASVPLVLRNIACDLVRARLYEDNITDRVAERERAAMKLLDQISSGAVSLGLDAAAQPTATTGGPAFAASVRVFTARSLGDYAP